MFRLLNIIHRWFCVRITEANCSSYFYENRHFLTKEMSHIRPQAKPLWRKQPQMDSLVLRNSPKSITFNAFSNRSFHEKQHVHFQASEYCLERILCFDFSNRLVFLFHENKHVSKKLVSYVFQGQATRWKTTAIWFSNYGNFVSKDTFKFALRLEVSLFVKSHLFISRLLNLV